MSQSASVGGPGYAASELRTKFIELEYRYLIESSFHSDDLRNQIIQFYLLVAGIAATAIVGLAQLASKPSTTPVGVPDFPVWSYSTLAFFVGLVGVALIPIFVRLRRVVIECLQGTVLLKGYVEQTLGAEGHAQFGAAMIWDTVSLPTDEHYATASFVLIFVVMLLDSAMFCLGLTLARPAWLSWEAWGLWSLGVSILVLTAQVIIYRLLLYRELRRAMASDRLADKWAALELTPKAATRLAPPRILRPIVTAALVGGAVVLLCAAAAFVFTVRDVLAVIYYSLT
ncbi:MAG: hypothetical protein U0768_05235 [Anaerolineae bacterium]